jgi:hypothetical protein
MTEETLFARAVLDPPTVYGTPEDVLADTNLSKSQMVEILRRWEYDASEISVAEEEGMAHVDGVTLDQILEALHKLVPHIDAERRPPTKQGGLDRTALGSRRSKT